MHQKVNGSTNPRLVLFGAGTLTYILDVESHVNRVIDRAHSEGNVVILGRSIDHTDKDANHFAEGKVLTRTHGNDRYLTHGIERYLTSVNLRRVSFKSHGIKQTCSLFVVDELVAYSNFV